MNVWEWQLWMGAGFMMLVYFSDLRTIKRMKNSGEGFRASKAFKAIEGTEKHDRNA